jgi:2,5-diamino-6-(ribosylamino)-4(3H)-pyrimidinone 5'-phosphate reductase
VFVSEKTPEKYLRHLEDRDIDYFVCGRDRVDLSAALKLLSEKYGAKTCLVESGGVLLSALLEQGLVDELSLLVYPVLVGEGGSPLFRSLKTPKDIRLELKSEKNLGGLLHLVYEAKK